MKSIFSFLLLTSFLLSACTKKVTTNQIELTPETTLKYSDAKKEKVCFTSLFDSVEVIPLDTIGDFLLDGIKQMHFCLDHIFITDQSKRLFVFDQKGIGQTIIDRFGQGGDEYIDIRNFDISLSDSLICALVYPSKLMYFTFDGKLVRQEQLDTRGFALNVSDKTITIFNDNAPEDKDKLLTIKDRNSQKEQDFIPGQRFLKGRTMPAYQQRRYFTKLPNGEALFFHPLSNLIYSLGNKEITIKYKLDFGNNNPSSDINLQLSENDDIFNTLDEYFPVIGFNSCWENDHYFYIQTRINKKPVDLLYDKKNKVFYAGLLLDDMVDCSVKFTQATNQHLIGYASTNDILDLLDYMKSKNLNLSEKKAQKKLFDLSERTGNPAVLRYKFK